MEMFNACKYISSPRPIILHLSNHRIKQADKFLDLHQHYTPDPEVLYGVMENQDHNSVACASRMVAEWRIGLPRTFAEPQP